VFRVDPEFLHYFCARAAHAKTMQSNHFPIEADVLIPELRNACFNRDTFPA
jgi:hypothetical protein